MKKRSANSKLITPYDVSVDPYIGKPEVARRMGRTVRQVEKMMRRGLLPYYKFDYQVTFRWSEIQAALAESCRIPQGLAHGHSSTGNQPTPIKDKRYA